MWRTPFVPRGDISPFDRLTALKGGNKGKNKWGKLKWEILNFLHIILIVIAADAEAV